MLNNRHVNQPPLVEGQRVEFKRQLTDGLEKEVVAFLNAHDGGMIYIGDELKRTSYWTSTGQATGQAETLLLYCVEPRTTKEMMAHLDVSHREHFRDSLLIPLLDSGQLEMTLPDKPRSPKQRYVTVKPTDDNHD